MNENLDNVKPKLAFERMLKEKLKSLDIDGDNITEKALCDADGNVISDTYVKNIAPKWKYYKAMLYQTGTNPPIAKILNKDEDDFLGDVYWSYVAPGIYSANSDWFDKTVTKIVFGNAITNSLDVKAIATIDDNNTLNMMIDDGGAQSDDMLNGTYIEISVKQRGESPFLLNSYTSQNGKTLFLEFNKELFINEFPFEIGKLNGETKTPIPGDYPEIDIEGVLIALNYVGVPFTIGDAIYIDYNKEGISIDRRVEAIDGNGLLESFSYTNVVNNSTIDPNQPL